jgi:UDP-N-acetylmuramate--L-alanine ligase
MNLEGIKKIYFVGIAGIAMSAAASLAKEAGFEVAGSDATEVYPPSKQVLQKSDIITFKGYNQENIKALEADLYVISAGEDLNNPEVKYIIDNDLTRCGFAELLYELNKEKLRVVVAGTHGKSTTTGLLGHLFKNLDNSGFMAGGVLQNYETNFYSGNGHYFVFEGDEYKNMFDDPTPKFQYYQADILVLTNLEFDHPDMFENFEALEQEFRLLIEKLPEDGLIIYNADDATLTKLVHESSVSSASFGIDNEADFKAEQIQYGADFITIEIMNKFSKSVSSKLLGQTEQYKIQLPGKINAYNALAGIALLRTLGFDQQQIALDLLSYKGIKRRFEIVGVKNGVTLVDDYAHHPTAVRETLEAARLKYPQAKIWAVFEPHTFSRTKATLADLAKSFDSANEVLISEIYPAREKVSEATIKSQEAVNAVKANQPSTRLVADKAEALKILKADLKPGDVVIVMAVGSFNRLAYELKEIL